jgi:acetyl-CoA carboxylase biotin carboxylase subunit
MLKKVLIANRGEIAVRIARTLRELGCGAVSVYTEADRGSLHLRSSDEAIALGPDPRAYLDAELLVRAAKRAGCDGVHPGYGFLSENADFAALCEEHGLTFIGPPAAAIRTMGSKQRARKAMADAGVPVVPGGDARTFEEAKLTADSLGYPVMVKAEDGGGGKGMRLVKGPEELASALDRARSEAKKAFGSDAVYIEKALIEPRHVEVQILGDREGKIVHLFERDCSLQRRHQKIIEESPCPVLDEATRARLCDVAIRGAAALGYHSAGTFEFLLDRGGEFYFLEMNTRLQVEHPISELVTGVDLVREMVLIAGGAALSLPPLELRGAAIEARLYAEDPALGFLPSPGRLTRCAFPSGAFVRVDSGVFEGAVVSGEYDPMLAKISVWAPDREQALRRLGRALDECSLAGVATNLDLLRRLCKDERVRAGEYHTGFVEQHLASLLDEAVPDPPAVIAAAVFADRCAPKNVARDASSSPSPWLALDRAARLGRNA